MEEKEWTMDEEIEKDGRIRKEEVKRVEDREKDRKMEG